MDLQMMAEREHEKSEVIQCGRLPKKADGSVDLYKIDRMLLTLETGQAVISGSPDARSPPSVGAFHFRG